MSRFSNGYLAMFFLIIQVWKCFKYKMFLSPVIINVFQFSKNSANGLRTGNHLQIANIQTAYFGSKSIKTLVVKIWDLKSIKFPHDFQEKDKEVDSKELPLSSLQDLYWPSWFHRLTFTFLQSPTTC